MTPEANFQVTPTLLSVKFTDISTGTPTGWSWDFGDASAADTTQNPTHAYSIAGKYVVKLTVTNADGTSYLQREIIVASTPILPVSVKTFVNIKLGGLTVSEETKDAYIAQAQLEIQPLVDPEISIEFVFDETKYPPLANALVAMLAAYWTLKDAVASGSAASGIGGTGDSAGAIKKIVTGPSEVEYQDSTSAQKGFFGKAGALEALLAEACGLAKRLNIQLTICPGLAKPVFFPVKAGLKGAPEDSPWLRYPSLLMITI